MSQLSSFRVRHAFLRDHSTHRTSENTLHEFPLVIATVAKVSRKRGLWLVVRVKKVSGVYSRDV